MSTTKILFLCVANSARSQIAEGLARKIMGDGFEIQSAGSNPSVINSLAITVLNELGIDSIDQFSKSVDTLSPEFLAQLDFVITLCAEEVCPVLISTATKLHWAMPDPAIADGNESERLAKFREVRDSITIKLKALKTELNK